MQVQCAYGAGRNNFDAGTIHYEGHRKGWALKSRHFWALQWQQEKRVPFGLSDALTTRLDFIHTRLDLIGMESIFFMKPFSIDPTCGGSFKEIELSQLIARLSWTRSPQ
jgi:hypothetical protein